MSDNHDIEEQFRDSAPLWDETPPDAAWDRLSDKLDAGQSARRLRLYRRMGLAASIFVVGLITFFWFNRNPEPELYTQTRIEQYFAQNQGFFQEHTPFVAPKSLQQKEEMVDKQADSLALGSTFQYSSSAVTTPSESNKLDKPVIPDSAVLFSTLDKFRQSSGWTNAYKAQEQDPEFFRNGMGVSADSLPSFNQGPIESMGMYNTLSRQDLLASYQWSKEESLLVSKDNDYISYSPNQNTSDTTFTLLFADRNFLGYTVADSTSLEADPLSIQHFNWLLGNWEGDAPSGNSFEAWSKVDEQTLVGKGFFYINGDTLLTEEMKIRQEGKNIYLITAIDSGGKPVRFRLSSVVGEAAIFENSSVDFPNEIIVEQHSRDNYSTIMKNGKMSNMRSAQRSYLNKRNNIYYNNEVIRNLKRSN